MTEVLQVPRQPDGQSYYQSAGIRRSPPSSSSLFLDTSPHSSSPKNIATPHADHQERLSGKAPSSLPPSAASSFETISSASSRYSTLDSFDSSVESNLSLDTDLDFPNYDDVPFGGGHGSRPAYGEDSSEEPPESTSTDTTQSDSPLPTPTVADDTAVRNDPSRQVDFLSHEWREEDIWASWRHIVSQRKTLYGERSRLKESDVTWLYGPLKTASSYPITQNVSEPDSQISKNNSFVNKKPILKKRSVSEVMLQKSLSTSSLVKQAASAVQAQGRSGRRSGANSDVVDSKLQSETPSRDQVDYFTSRSTSSGGTPCEAQEKRHIRFDDRVEQCIAVDCKDVGLDEDEESEDETEEQGHHSNSDSSSDDGVVMMKRKKTPKQKKPKSDRSRSSSTSGRKTIETLPATTLKYRTDSPDVTEEAQHHTFGRSWNSGNLSPSPSQETLRPSHPSSNFLLPEEDDDEEEIDSDSSWSFGAANPKSSLGASTRPGRDGGSSSRNRSSTPGPSSSDYKMEGMRRTASGMFMPYDEDEDDAVAAGLFGRVSETFNTARDIAHVIWNVGWRK
ncbi:hypothetical protein PRZ48_001608 [Zasmidium cellare]|uniref:Nitrogen regulatory protein areA GATA-like domain-containing protein n=1 Tax=Zasmidium cellare TaxID=395010 RepID=A0ABR0F322_ZASCE|nr:hypothetical protein PRZ48_001608 [Zasmidium cellare]